MICGMKEHHGQLNQRFEDRMQSFDVIRCHSMSFDDSVILHVEMPGARRRLCYSMLLLSLNILLKEHHGLLNQRLEDRMQ